MAALNHPCHARSCELIFGPQPAANPRSGTPAVAGTPAPREDDMVGTIIGLIIAGIIIGALARLFMPGRQAIGMIATIVVGIIGTLVGYWIAAALGVEETNGIDWIRWIISIIVAIILVAITASIMGRGRGRTLT
jgi:uncharacterized membrane protein YeaQ/YmgE (transglycosylase-associated protein family)